jgi:tryptophan synthase alpha subunit
VNVQLHTIALSFDVVWHVQIRSQGFIQEFAASGIDGILIHDLPPEQADAN